MRIDPLPMQDKGTAVTGGNGGPADVFKSVHTPRERSVYTPHERSVHTPLESLNIGVHAAYTVESSDVVSPQNFPSNGESQCLPAT